MLIALITVAIVVARHRKDGERSVALGSLPVTQREASAAGSNFRAAAVEMAKGSRHDVIAPAERTDGIPQVPDSSGLRAFLELREVPTVDVVREDVDEFASETRDPNWSAQMEAQLQSQLSQTNLTLTGSYIECKTSRCIVVLVRPTAAYDQREQVGLPNRAIVKAMSDAARTLGLLGSQSYQILAGDGALVHWQRLHRRCAPDWRCPQ
jgi:hypothetical protein